MKITFKEAAFFEGGYYYPGDSVEKPPGFTLPREYSEAVVIEGESPKEEPKKTRRKKDDSQDPGELEL